MAMGKCLHVGGTFVLARKFSATRFWDDVYNNNVTVCYVSIMGCVYTWIYCGLTLRAVCW